MKTLLTTFALLIGLVACKTSKPVKSNVSFLTPDSSGLFNADSIVFDGKNSGAFYILSKPPDTIPVILYAVDTTMRGYGTTISINGYSIGNYSQTYLNHLKQPLPERLIVWMVCRRKDR